MVQQDCLIGRLLSVFHLVRFSTSATTSPQETAKPDIDRYTFCLQGLYELSAGPTAAKTRFESPGDFVVACLIPIGWQCDR
jgi:hypothetical protein